VFDVESDGGCELFCGERVEETVDAAPGQRSHESRDLDPVEERDDGRNGDHSECDGRLGFVPHIDAVTLDRTFSARLLRSGRRRVAGRYA
jgi:hypothetical protein